MTPSKDISQQSHSLESVTLSAVGTELQVRKHSPRASQRFLAAIEKQRRFQPIALSELRVAAVPILEVSRGGAGEVSMVMPYVHGLSGADFALHGTREIAADISKSLSAILMSEMNAARMVELQTVLLLEKMESVLASSNRAALQEPLRAAAARLRCLLSGSETLLFPAGDCHGDLTLSNVILSHSKGLLLIDFLDSFLESPLQDAAKIRQDLVYGWSFRKLDSHLWIKGMLFATKATPTYLSELESLFPILSEALDILCLARIAPYVRDESTEKWLTGALRKCLSLTRPTGNVANGALSTTP
jgi:hypothetical protein